MARDNECEHSGDEAALREPLSQPSRRRFLQSAAAAATVGAAPHLRAQTQAPVAPAAGTAQTVPPRPVTLNVNGRSYALQLEPRVTLLDALREYAGLMGTKKGCDRGQCGACTVIANGRRINSCLTLALMHEGETITTVEGLASNGALSPLQRAFIEHDAFQCGYCTPGQICSAVAMLEEGHAKTADDVRELMSGNLCRCGAYNNIVAAILDVSEPAEAAEAAEVGDAGARP